MSFRSIAYILLFISLERTAYSQFYSCASNADCRAFLNPSCDTFMGMCIQPWDDSDCNYLEAGAGYMVTVSGTALCTRTCSSHSDCASLPTAKICRTTVPRYCVECLNTDDCTAMGFKNHNCNSGFCASPNPSGTDCNANSPYCSSTSKNCFVDAIRCWYPCTFNGDCTDSTCVLGVTFNGGGVCSSRTNLPPSISPAGCTSNDNCAIAAASQCSGGNCVACSDDPHCAHLSSTPLCVAGTCRACRPTDHSGCTSESLARCDPGTYTCTTCDDDSQCTRFSSTLYCRGGTCRVCRTSDHAGCTSESLARCDPGTYTCTTCDDDSQCTRFSSTPHCGGGTCRVCRISDHAGCGSISAPKCDPSTYTCMTCDDDPHCAHLSSTPLCVAGTCRACRPTDHSGCTSESLARCDPGTYTCTACSSDEECFHFPPTTYCEGGICRECKTSDNKGCSSITASKCTSTPSYSCIACTGDEHCTHLSSTPYCEGGTCSMCKTADNTGCLDPTSPKCISAPDYTCGPCLDDGDCTPNFLSTPLCVDGECRQCNPTNDNGCSATASKCDSTSYTCTPCSIDTDCAHLSSTPYCESNSCVACKTSDNSGCGGSTPFCVSGACGACKPSDNTVCTLPTASKCDHSSYTCTSCSDDSDCEHLDPNNYCESGICRPCKPTGNIGCDLIATPRCDSTSYTCTTCSIDDDCARFSPTVYCVANTCVACKTTGNIGCNLITAPRCDSTSYTCTTCSVDSDCNPFSPNLYCEGGACVICKTSDNSGCTMPSPKCVSTPSYACTTCTVDGDCSSPTPYCESNSCVACKTSDNSGCSGGTPFCVSGACRICKPTDNIGCTLITASKCDPSSYTCTSCSADADCAHLAPNKYCDSGTCRSCNTLSNSGCTTLSSSKCDPSSYTCIACSVDGDCGHLDPNKYCVAGTCRPCEPTGNIGCDLITVPRCDSSTYTCTTCSVDEDCNRFSPYSYCESNTCVACKTSDNTPCTGTTPYCVDGDCRVCKPSDNSGCSSTTAPRCSSSSSYTCTGCSVDADCARFDPTPYCGGGGSCVSCRPSDNSGCTDVAASKCDPLSYTCTQCSADADCEHLDSTPYCEGNTCRPCKTSDNSGCTTVTASKCISSPSGYSCTSCSDDSDCNNFPSTPNCDDGKCQVCKTSDNSGCTSTSQPKCVTDSSGSNLCGECITNQDCVNSPVGKYCSSGYTCTAQSTTLSTANLTLSSSSKRDLTITFSENLSELPPDCQFFFLQIEKLNWPQDFSYTWEIKDDHTISIALTYYGEIEIHQNKLEVLFNASAIPASSNFTIPKNLSLILPDFVPLPASVLTISSGINTASQVVVGVTVSSAIPSLFSSGTASSLWNFIEICQLVNYLLYMLVVWPENAQMVFKFFSAANLDFLPNPFQNIIDNITEMGSVIKIPDIFSDNGAEGLFLASSGSTVGVWAIIALFYILVKISRCVLRNSTGRFARVTHYFCDNLEWRAVVRAITSNFLPISLDLALQLYSTSFENWVVSLSTVLAVLSGYLLFFFTVVSSWILYSRPKEHDEMYQKKYGPLFEDFKNDTKFQRSFIMFVLVRKATFVAFLVGFSHTAKAQVPLVAINSFVMFAFIILLKPFKERKDTILNTINEAIICCLMVCALILHNDQTRTYWMTYSSKITLGWVVVGFCSVLVLVNAGFMIYDSYQTYKNWFLLLKAKWKKRAYKAEKRPSRREKRQQSSRVHFIPDLDSPIKRPSLCVLNETLDLVPSILEKKHQFNDNSTLVDLNESQPKVVGSTIYFVDDSKLSSERKKSTLSQGRRKRIMKKNYQEDQSAEKLNDSEQNEGQKPIGPLRNQNQVKNQRPVDILLNQIKKTAQLNESKPSRPKVAWVSDK